MKRGLVTAAVITVLILAWIGSGQLGDGEATDVAASDQQQDQSEAVIAPAVRTIHSEARSTAQEITLFGRTEVDRYVKIRAETDSRVVSLVVEKGDAVSGEALMAALDIGDRQARVNQAQAQVKHREAAYRAAKELSQKQFTSEVKLAEELAALESARATLAASRVELTRTRIKAPFGGIAGDVMVELGDYVQAGDVIARIDDLDPLIVAVEVTERDIADIESGQAAEIRLESGETRTGVVGYVASTGNAKTRTFRVEVEIDNTAFDIAAGMTAEVTLATRPVLAHRLSPAVLTLDDLGRLGVKAVDQDNVAVFHAVRVIADTTDGVWVTGLPLQSNVIVVGQEFVLPGQRVTVVESGT